MFYINYYYSVDTPENRNLEQNNPLHLGQNLIPWLPFELSKRHKKAAISAQVAFYLGSKMVDCAFIFNHRQLMICRFVQF